MSAISYATLGKLLYDFENENLKLCKENKVASWNSWSIIKCPIFFTIYNTMYKKIEVNHKRQRSIKKRIYVFFSFLYCIPRMWNKKNALVLFTHSFYKQDKLSNGLFYNTFMDGFLETAAPILYIEKSDNGNFKLPSLRKYDVPSDGLYGIIFLLKISLKIFCFQKKNSKKISFYLNTFFKQRNIDYTLNPSLIQSIFINFYSEYFIYKLFFYFIKPRIVVFHDEIGSGKMAAAKILNIPTIELQHGILDLYNPYYSFSNQLKSIKKNMVIPTTIGVFGDYHKKLVNQTGFWEDKELFSLGNKRMDVYRKNKITRSLLTYSTNTYNVVFISQWNVFKELRDLISYFLSKKLDVGFELWIKIHPRDSQEQVKWYEKIKNENTGLSIKIFKEDKNIYDILMQSHLVIGYNSALLLESVALGVPTLTVATKDQPQGIHSLLGDDILASCIKTIYNNEDIDIFIDKLNKDQLFYDNWKKQTIKLEDYLYAQDHIEKCKLLIDQYFNKTK